MEKRVWKTGRLSWFAGEFGNSTLAMLSGGGLILVVILYGMIGFIVLSGMDTLRKMQRGAPPYVFVAALISAIMGLLVNAQAEAWLMSPITWPTIFFWFYCGLLFYIGRVAPRGGFAGRRVIVLRR